MGIKGTDTLFVLKTFFVAENGGERVNRPVCKKEVIHRVSVVLGDMWWIYLSTCSFGLHLDLSNFIYTSGPPIPHEKNND